ncbi:hypothetical protein HHK36_005664 [Tetracentron sinense]|uniref:Uncharacterized protein n=1 Tax=Tetracentron sinense TaxID=13715 RepID=A0A834ZLU7_TETSI|nr:hypothetical protein HHK36_005664 [Tetracentron sinense]
MKMMKVLIVSVAIVMALAIALTIASTKGKREKPPIEANDVMKDSSEKLSLHRKKLTVSKRVTRFLAAESPRAADHCHKNNTICSAKGSQGPTCCNNKCVDLETDHHYCGDCKNMCEYTETCCGGECVELAFDKRHCGECNNKCGAFPDWGFNDDQSNYVSYICDVDKLYVQLIKAKPSPFAFEGNVQTPEGQFSALSNF